MIKLCHEDKDGEILSSALDLLERVTYWAPSRVPLILPVLKQNFNVIWNIVRDAEKRLSLFDISNFCRYLGNMFGMSGFCTFLLVRVLFILFLYIYNLNTFERYTSKC